MCTDSAIVLPRATRPGSFTGLMTLYESNYIRWRELAGGLEHRLGEHVSVVSADQPLHISVLELCRYTATLRMSYYFEENGEAVADPDLRVRIYHDARLAEAMACGTQRRHELLRAFDPCYGSQLQQRWARNMMLNKWLEYCLDKQHRFDVPATGAAKPLSLGSVLP